MELWAWLVFLVAVAVVVWVTWEDDDGTEFVQEWRKRHPPSELD